MKNSKIIKIISKYYFLISNKTEGLIEKWIKKDVEKSKSIFYKRYQVEPREQDIRDMKKDIVMRKGIYCIIILILLSIAIVH